ncbi:uncharacterized protein LOC116254471 [Nymphaea colorata]|nr:uncharacterized protein LOC116254471 [Nymphaea colorata]
MVRANKACIASVHKVTETKPKESNSELNAEDASSLVIEGMREEKLQGESNPKVKEEKEASDDAEEAKEKNKGNEKEEVEEARKKDNSEVDGNFEAKKVDEGGREVDAKEPNKDKEMEMVKESREETKNDKGKKKKMTKKTTRLIKKKNIAAKNDDKGIVGVEDGEMKKTVKGDEKKEQISVDEQKMEANADEAKKEAKPCMENKEVKLNEKKEQKLQNNGKRKRENKVDDSLVSQETKSLKNKDKVTTENVEMVASYAGDAGKTSDSGIKESAGLIFMCSKNTKRDCFKYKVLGLPANKKELVAKVYKGMRLFLFDVDHRLMYGIYRAAGRGGYNIEPRAFNSAFPSQVRFKVVSECTPLPEEKFKAAINDNYVGRKRFNIELTGEQVKKLCKLFTSSRNDDLVRKDSGSLGIDKRQRRRVRGRRHGERVRDQRPATTSNRSLGVHMGTLSRSIELSRGDEPVSRVRGIVREREPIRAHRLSRDSTLISGVHGLPRENTLVSEFHGLSRERFPRERLLVDGVHRRETGIYDYDREASDIYTREVYALPPLPSQSYVHEDSLHADLRRRELEVERRERRLLELEQRQKEMIRYEQPYQYNDPTIYHDRQLPYATDYTSRRGY